MVASRQNAAAALAATILLAARPCPAHDSKSRPAALEMIPRRRSEHERENGMPRPGPGFHLGHLPRHLKLALFVQVHEWSFPGLPGDLRPSRYPGNR